jgi:cytochrome b6-f complex iron-sulfur subunit
MLEPIPGSRFMQRRQFIKEVVSKILTVLAGLFVAFPAFSFMTFHKPKEKRIRFSPDEQTASVAFKEGIFLVRGEGSLKALSARCTHLGCTLRYEQLAHRFECPCHGSMFDINGHRIAGPAKKDLREIPLIKGRSGELSAILKL